MPPSPLLVQLRIERALDSCLRRAPERDQALTTTGLSWVAGGMGVRFWRRMPLGPPSPAPTPCGRFLQTWLGPDQKSEITHTFWFAVRHGIPSVLAALKTYAGHAAAVRLAPTIDECVAEWLSENRGHTPAHQNSIRWALREFCATYGRRRPQELSATELAVFSAKSGHPP